MAELKDKVNFGIIRYANCWEDADVLLAALRPMPGDRILSIASGGDNSLSLLVNGPSLVLAADLSPVQLYVTELKREAIRSLEREETLAFLGFSHSENRRRLLSHISGSLSAPARRYWQHHAATVEAGLVSQGRFENYFRIFSRYVLPLIHSKAKTEKLLAEKSGEEQAAFYDKEWNSTRWKMMFRIFFSRAIMGRLGRDPEFMRQVTIPVGKFIYNQAGNHLREKRSQNNFILRFALTGKFQPLLPHYLQADNYYRIRNSIACLDLTGESADRAAAAHGNFHSMNLSNIFEYMDTGTFVKAAGKLAGGLAMNGRAAYWNLMVPRQMSAVLPELRYLENESKSLTKADKGFFYSNFILEEKLGP